MKLLFDLLESKQKGFIKTPSGDVSIEQLYSLPLVSERASTLSLEKVAIYLNSALKEYPEESFVSIGRQTKSQEKETLQIQLEIVVAFIKRKEELIKEKVSAKEKADYRTLLENALKTKTTENITSLTIDELKSKLDALK